MNLNDTITVEFDNGTTMTAFIEDRVLPDRTCGQYDSGWIIYDDKSNEDDLDAPCWFLSDEGIVYDYGTPDAVGKCTKVMEVFNTLVFWEDN